MQDRAVIGVDVDITYDGKSITIICGSILGLCWCLCLCWRPDDVWVGPVCLVEVSDFVEIIFVKKCEFDEIWVFIKLVDNRFDCDIMLEFHYN